MTGIMYHKQKHPVVHNNRVRIDTRGWRLFNAGLFQNGQRILAHHQPDIDVGFVRR
jgi:hypothetical protein